MSFSDAERLLMVSAAVYNRKALGAIWNLQDLPESCLASKILLQGDLDRDLSLEPDELDRIDWIAFSRAVGDFQLQQGIEPQDGKLGPVTLQKLRESSGVAPAPSDLLKSLGDLRFRRAAVPVSHPPGPPLVGRTPEGRSVADLWNRYGAAISRQAQAHQLPVEAALAVFCVESKTAYDPRTGLVIIRFEPHVFQRKSGQWVAVSRGGQADEWRNLSRAYALDADAALWSTSYGLPQLMGFNWRVTGHPDVRAMALAFQNSCEEQVAGFFGFVEKNGLVRYILNADWGGFTRRYNGPGNVAAYSSRLIRALTVVNALKKTGAAFLA